MNIHIHLSEPFHASGIGRARVVSRRSRSDLLPKQPLSLSLSPPPSLSLFLSLSLSLPLFLSLSLPFFFWSLSRSFSFSLPPPTHCTPTMVLEEANARRARNLLSIGGEGLVHLSRGGERLVTCCLGEAVAGPSVRGNPSSSSLLSLQVLEGL